MHISWNWLSEYVDLTGFKSAQELADLLTQRGLEVEAIRRLDTGFEKVITAQILEKNRHPEADRLSLCKVSIGSGEPLEIVCGAQNMKAGDRVALAQIGAQLPNGVKIERSKIRGVVSNGMLCSEQELGLKDSSEGILILAEKTPLGKPLADVLGRNDTILELKITPNRGDCLSYVGIAREVAAATGMKLKLPATPALKLGKGEFEILLEAGDHAPQFWGCVIEGVKVGASPDWLVKRLEAAGSRSINDVVDATNFVMLELGHPTHAYDADLLEGKKMSVKMGKKGEKIPLLDKTQVELNGSELVIADGKRSVALAGVMGGGNSEVSLRTKKLFLECAEFSPVLVRRAAFQHQKHSDAAFRFQRGIDPNGPTQVVSRLAHLIVELAGGKIISTTAATSAQRDPKKGAPKRQIVMDVSYVGDYLGMQASPEKIEKVLSALGCDVSIKGKMILVAPPSYRLDLNLKEDLVEEVARAIGYDQIPSTIPPVTTFPAVSDAQTQRFWQIERAKDALVELGFQEALSYSFTSAKWLENFGMQSSIPVLNPLSEEQGVMTPSLIPGLVEAALRNWNHHFGSEPLSIRLFEIRPTFQTKKGVSSVTAISEMETSVEEQWKLAFLCTGPRIASGLRQDQADLDFSDMKAAIEGFFEKLGTRGVRISPLGAYEVQNQSNDRLIFHPGKASDVFVGSARAGSFGLIHPALIKKLKLRGPLWLAELDWEVISKLSLGASEARKFKSWPEFPGIERDFALVVKNEVESDKITQVAMKAGKPLAKVVKVFDTYRGHQVAQGMTSIAVRVIFLDEGRSLQESEADAASARILEKWKQELGAELRS